MGCNLYRNRIILSGLHQQCIGSTEICTRKFTGGYQCKVLVFIKVSQNIYRIRSFGCYVMRWNLTICNSFQLQCFIVHARSFGTIHDKIIPLGYGQICIVIQNCAVSLLCIQVNIKRFCVLRIIVCFQCVIFVVSTIVIFTPYPDTCLFYRRHFLKLSRILCSSGTDRQIQQITKIRSLIVTSAVCCLCHNGFQIQCILTTFIPYRRSIELIVRLLISMCISVYQSQMRIGSRQRSCICQIEFLAIGPQKRISVCQCIFPFAHCPCISKGKIRCQVFAKACKNRLICLITLVSRLVTCCAICHFNCKGNFDYLLYQNGDIQMVCLFFLSFLCNWAGIFHV